MAYVHLGLIRKIVFSSLALLVLISAYFLTLPDKEACPTCPGCSKAFELRELRSFTFPTELKEFYDELYEVSELQRGVDKKVLTRALTFMLQERNEYDPELVAFVKSLLIKIERRRPRQIGDVSQKGQSAFIDKVLNGKRDGFYIEAGAHNGEFVSNSIFFEFNRNWTGLLIEPTPHLFNALKNANRSAYILNACLAKKRPMVAKFRVWDAITGRESEMSVGHKRRLDVLSKNNNRDRHQTIYVPCFSLNTIMHALGVSRVDYLSLDIEGGENDVVQSLNLARLDIRALSIEYTGNRATKGQIKRRLVQNHYELIHDDGQDFYFLKRAFSNKTTQL